MRNKKEKKKKEKKAEPAVVKTNLDILPIRRYDEKLKAFILKDGRMLDIVEKTADDVDNMLEDEIQYLMISFARFLKLYADDIKLVTMNFPTNTINQQKHLESILERTNDPVRRKWLQRSISELQKVDRGTRKREYYLMIFSEDVKSHMEHMKEVSTMGDGVREMTFEKKVKILYKLNNMNSLVIAEREE